MSMRSTAVTAAMLLATVALAQGTPATAAKPAAQPAKQAEAVATLTVGDKAPALSVEKWVKGEPITGFEKGKVYIVEFWATWCGPCVRAFPHLTELQKEYKDKGLTIIGMTSADPNNTLAKVEKMVADKGDIMGYTVAWDTERKTNKAYMQAAQQNGIPCSFVVNQDGVIAYIGHPMGLDKPLAQIMAGKYDVSAAKADFNKAKAQEEAQMAGMAALNKFNKDFKSLIAAGKFDEAYKLAGAAVDGDLKNNAGGLNAVAWTIVDPEHPLATKDLDLALKAANRAAELTEHKEPAILDTLARVHFVKGDSAKAIEIQKKAVELADGEMKAELEKALKEYEAAKK